MPDFITRICRI